MTTKSGTQPPHKPAPFSRGHGYCWAEHSSHVRCTLPTGHTGKHLYPYTPRTEW
jgi:hypothetical protein